MLMRSFGFKFGVCQCFFQGVTKDRVGLDTSERHERLSGCARSSKAVETGAADHMPRPVSTRRSAFSLLLRAPSGCVYVYKYIYICMCIYKYTKLNYRRQMYMCF